MNRNIPHIANRSEMPSIRFHARTEDGVGVQLRSDPPGILDVPGMDRVLVSIHVGSPAKVSCTRAGDSHSGNAADGDIDIIPAGTAARWEVHDRIDTALLVGIPSALLSSVIEERGLDPSRVVLKNRFQVRDKQLDSIGWLMKRELEAGNPCGRLFMDGLSLSAAAHLVARHSSVAVHERLYGRLNGRTLKKILYYIDEHLTDNLSLAVLAQVAGLSQSHFRTGFRDSTGATIHQYVIRQKVERAKALLKKKELSIANIAAASGFAHQSHLSRHLQRTFGVSPTEMRRLFPRGTSAENMD
jgi:AraC family transcriptional regulator